MDIFFTTAAPIIILALVLYSLVRGRATARYDYLVFYRAKTSRGVKEGQMEISLSSRWSRGETSIAVNEVAFAVGVEPEDLAITNVIALPL